MWGAIISGVLQVLGQVGGPLLGKFLGDKDREQAEEWLTKVYEMYGTFEPAVLEKVAAQELGQSRMETVQTDPRLKDAQLSALDELQNVYQSGGETAQDRATLNEAMTQANRAATGQSAALRERLAARGALDSGAGLVLQQQAAQSGAERARQTALDVAGNAQSRALEAMLKSGQLGGDIRGQDFSEQSAKARAADEIARYNADARTRAGLTNLDVERENERRRVDAMDRKAKAMAGRAGLYSDRAAQTAGMWSGVGQGVGNAAASFGQYASKRAEEEDKKKVL